MNQDGVVFHAAAAEPSFSAASVTGRCVAAILAACGGGSSTPNAQVLLGQSTVSGTVTGFGSLIVDGVRINNSAAAAGKEHDDGTVEAVELKLGQHVEVEHDGLLVATKVRVAAEVEGAHQRRRDASRPIGEAEAGAGETIACR